MKKHASVLAMTLLVAGLCSFSFTSKTTATTPTPVVEGGTDVLAFIKEMNGPGKPLPTDHFKPGHATFATYENYLTKLEKGFVIKLPSNTNVPTATVSNGQLLVGGGFGSKQYFAFDPKTGVKTWAMDIDDDGPSSSVEEDGTTVFNTESCTIFALDTKTGRYLWSHWLGDPLMSMPTISNGKVFTSYPAAYTNNYSGKSTFGDEKNSFSPTHVLAAFDLKTGKVLWQKWIDGDVMSAPVACGEDLYFSTFPGTLYQVKQSDGEFLSANSIRATSAPVIFNDQIIISRRSDENNVCSESVALLNKTTMTIEKQYLTKNAVYLDKTVQEKTELKSLSMNYDAGNGFSGGAPSTSGWMTAESNIGQSNVSSLQSFQGSRILVIDGKTYSSMGDELVCGDPLDGKKIWSTQVLGDMHKVGGHLSTPPIKAGDNMIIATYGGEVIVYDPKTGRVKERFATQNDPIRYQPVAHDGMIYVTTTTGKLYAFQSSLPDVSGWPMWGGNAGHTNLAP
jgi:Ca-activated chloride channel homolog